MVRMLTITPAPVKAFQQSLPTNIRKTPLVAVRKNKSAMLDNVSILEALRKIAK